MKFKTSLFNKGLMISDFKRLWWVSALYALVLFFVFPFSFMMMDQDALTRWKSQTPGFAELFFSNGIQSFLIGIVPVILAVLVFRYLQTARSSAMAHSLPCNRKTLYISHSISGLILLTAPVFLNTLFLTIIKLTASAGVLITPLAILKWLGITLVFEILFYSFTIFVGMFTGNSISHLAFTYILNVLPFGFLYLLDYNLSNLVYGYGGNIYHRGIEDNLPIFSLSSYCLDKPFLSARYIIYAILSVVFFISAWAVYEKRHLESAGDIITFTSIRPVFKYGITICVTLLSSLYFLNLQNSSFAVVVIGYLISSLLGYYISEILLQKSLKVWNAYKGYIGYATLLILVLIGIKTDITGYEKRVPDAGKVKSVFWGNSVYEWEAMSKTNKSYFPHDIDIYTLKNKESIQNIVSLHKQLTHEKNPPKYGLHRSIIYTLKDGSNIIRQYNIDEKINASALRPVYESTEYKEARFPVLVQKTEDLKYIEIRDNRIRKKPVILSNNSEINEFTSLLRKDILSLKYETLALNGDFCLMAYITPIKGEPIAYALRNNYSNSLKWLKDKGHYEKVVLLPEDVTSMQIINRSDGINRGKSVEIKDIKVIKELLDISVNERSEGNYIQVGFSTSRNGWSYPLDLDTPMSDELRKYIKQIQN